MQPSYSGSDMQKRIEIETLRTKWQQLDDISSKDAFIKEIADRSDLLWEDVVEDLVPIANDSQVRTSFLEVE
jgi:hypothetical protein